MRCSFISDDECETFFRVWKSASNKGKNSENERVSNVECRLCWESSIHEMSGKFIFTMKEEECYINFLELAANAPQVGIQSNVNTLDSLTLSPPRAEGLSRWKLKIEVSLHCQSPPSSWLLSRSTLDFVENLLWQSSSLKLIKISHHRPITVFIIFSIGKTVCFDWLASRLIVDDRLSLRWFSLMQPRTSSPQQQHKKFYDKLISTKTDKWQCSLRFTCTSPAAPTWCKRIN